MPDANPGLTASSGFFATISQHIKLHEKLIAFVFLILFGIFAYSKYLTYEDLKNQRADTLAHAALQADVTKNAANATANAQAADQYKALTQQLLAQNQALASARIARDIQTQAQQAKDQTLTPPDLAARWVTLLKIPSTEIQPTNVGFNVTLSGAQQTVVQLETIEPLKADLAGEVEAHANSETLRAKAEGLVAGLRGENTGLKKTIVDQAASCKADVAAVTAKMKKSRWHWFWAGFAVGFAGREIIKDTTGH